MANPAPLDPTVEQLYQAAEDVEMQDAYPIRDKGFLYVVIDTNVLIDYRGILEQFCEDVERIGYPIMIIVPSVVLSELDGLKNKPELRWFARQASTWLLKKVKERTTVKLQSSKETLSPGAPAATDTDRMNDLAIRDCCLYFARSAVGYGALMVSMDKNLCLECVKEELQACTPPQRGWSSRSLAQHLPVPGVDLSAFRDREAFPRYRPSRSDESKRKGRIGQTEGPTATSSTSSTSSAIMDEDSMDIDQTDSYTKMEVVEEYVPLHARDSLHKQIAEHFTELLRDLALRVHTACGDVLTVSVSAHAPAWRRLELSKWSAGVCLLYLQTKKPFRYEAWMPGFFVRRGEDGWRRGQEWSPAMWKKALDMLGDVARMFEDRALMISLTAVGPHVTEVWEAKLRPN